MPNMFLVVTETAVKKTDKNPCLHRAYILIELKR